MGKDSHPPKATQRNLVFVPLTFEGGNGLDGTISEGGEEILSVVRQSEGIYRVSFKANRPYFMGCVGMPDIWAETPANVAGYTATHDTLITSGTNYYVDVSVYNASDTLADLLVNEFLTCVFMFRETSRTS